MFAYDVQQEFSKYHVEADDDKLSIVPAYRGLVYIDEDTKMVVKIVMTPYDMPSTFPIHDITSSLDYDLETIGDQQYMLPLKSVLTSKRDRQMTRNDIEFRLYRKFGTEAASNSRRRTRCLKIRLKRNPRKTSLKSSQQFGHGHFVRTN